MDLSIIIVNYKSQVLLSNCLNSIFSQPSKILIEIIVVDNYSEDDSENKILKEFPSVKWIQMNYNSGFARANNVGIKKSSAEIVLLLNADTIIKDNAIEKCYYNFINSDYVACSVQLLNADNTPQITGNYAMKGGINYLLPLPYLGSLFKWMAGLAGVKKPNVSEAKGTVDVDWINGAFLMFRKSATETAGLLDEDFFMYAEEAEWCARLQKIGKLCIFGDLHVIHLQGETSNEVYGSSGKGYKNLFDKKGLQIMLSNLVRIRKQFGVGWFLLIMAVYIFEIPVFFIGWLLSIVFNRKRFVYMQVKNYAFNIMRIIRLTPTIIRNRPYFYKT
jgi:GT2 family glycosyltransferase